MSNKIELNIVAGALNKHGLSPSQVRAILEDLQLELEPDQDAEPKSPPVKKQFVIVVSDPLGHLPHEDFVGWVVQIPESEAPQTTLDRIIRTAHDFNSTKRGRLLPVQTVGECIETARARQFKANDVWVKTKTPVLIVRTSNEIGETPSLLSDSDRGITSANHPDA